jgi:hypothetical protein
VTLAEKVVHDSLRDDNRQRQLIDDFISGVGSGAQANARLESAGSERSQ